MIGDPSWFAMPVGMSEPDAPAEPLRAVLETLGSRIGELETRARVAEERADRAEANYSSVHHHLFEERKKVEQLKGERDAAVADYFTRRPKVDELEERISNASRILRDHPRSGAKALAILRPEADPE